jgi:hypothetical protein
MIKELLFEHTVPTQVILWALVAALVIGLFSFWRYLPRTLGIGMLVLIRVLFLVGLAWCLFRPTERRRENEHLKPRFLVIADTSASMGLTPQKEIPARWSVVQEVLKQPWANDLASKVELDGYGFDTTVTSKLALNDLAALPIKGNGTRLRDSLQQVLDRYKGQPLAGVLLLTDGLDTREVGDEWTAGPWPAPIYTVQLEPPGSWAETPDVRVVRVDTPRRVVVGWQSELTALVCAVGTKGVPLSVQLYENDKLIQELPTQIAAGGGTKEVKFQLEHKSVGNFVYKVKVPALPKETVLENNEFSMAVEVTDTKNRVLYVEGAPRYEFKFLKRALERNKEITPMMLLQGGDGKLMSVGYGGNVNLTMSREQLSGFKVAILGNMDGATLGDERAKALVKFVDEGGSLVLMGGDVAWSARGFAATPLKELLPVQPDGSEPREGNYPVSLTKDGQTHPALKSLAAKWSKPMPVLSIFPVAKVSQGATTVMNAGEQPLIVTQRFGQGKVAAILSSSLWRWQLEPGQKDEYLAFWDGLIQWLMPQASEASALSLDLTADLEQLFLGDSITLTSRLGSSADKQTSGTPTQASLEIQVPDGRKIPFPMQPLPTNATAAKNGPGYTVAYKADTDGMHSAIASVTVNGRKIDSAPFSFFVKPFTPETSPGPQAFDALRALSKASGGQFCDKARINEVLSALEVKTSQEERVIYHNLYDSPFLLAALMMLLGADWILRKRRNMA